MSKLQERKAELEAVVRELEAEEKREAAARKAAVKPQWQFTLLPHKQALSYERIRDESVKVYRLEGFCVNVDELAEAGYGERDSQGGGMNYLFNTLSGRIVMAHGGGRIWISDGSWSGQGSKAAADKAFSELEAFLKEHAEGGDVTEIIARQEATV